MWDINHHNRLTGVDLLQCLDRPKENPLGLVKIVTIGGKIGEGIIGFWPLTNSILVFRPQTTVQSFIKFDSKLRPQERWQTDRRQRSYNLSHAICTYGCTLLEWQSASLFAASRGAVQADIIHRSNTDLSLSLRLCNSAVEMYCGRRNI